MRTKDECDRLTIAHYQRVASCDCSGCAAARRRQHDGEHRANELMAQLKDAALTHSDGSREFRVRVRRGFQGHEDHYFWQLCWWLTQHVVRRNEDGLGEELAEVSVELRRPWIAGDE